MPLITGNAIGTIAEHITEAEFNGPDGDVVARAVLTPSMTVVQVHATLTPLQLERWVLYLNEVTR